ncbi:hypothetical protein ACKWTF_011126 [Chironomus riparius]
MKFMILIPILVCVILDISNAKEEAEAVDIIESGICYNQQPGSTFPDLNNCSQFMICIDRNGLILSRCPQNMPYFDHCLSRCVSNRYVCTVVNCYGGTTIGTTTALPWSTTPTTTYHVSLPGTTRTTTGWATITSTVIINF